MTGKNQSLHGIIFKIVNKVIKRHQNMSLLFFNVNIDKTLNSRMEHYFKLLLLINKVKKHKCFNF